MSYKRYLFILDDLYSIKQLKNYIGTDNFWDNISKKAYNNSKKIIKAKINNVSLNDKYNEKVIKEGKTCRQSIYNPVTLFSPYCLINEPDIMQTYPIGFPISDKKIQDIGYNYCQEGIKSKEKWSFIQNNIERKSPYISHCSSYVSWIAQIVFGVSLVPSQIGNWCNAAAQQRDIMENLKDYWEKVSSLDAQYAANEGKFALAAKKMNDLNRKEHEKNGHIAVILPITWKIAKELQTKNNYPKTPIINDITSFQEFILLYGPEIAQSGRLNFSHTVTANGFSNYYPNDKIPGNTPIDEIIDFYVYKL